MLKMPISFGCLLLVTSFLMKVQAGSDVDSGPGDIIFCTETPSEYYAIDLVTTKNIPGTGQATGKAVMKFNPSPFGISIAKDGSYQHKLDIQLKKVNKPKNGQFVAWVTTSSLDKIKRIGSLDDQLKISGTVEWNKYLVVITWEKPGEQPGSSWKGPIAFRGLSRSGLMHTMAGHGPFEQEPCAKYGYY